MKAKTFLNSIAMTVILTSGNSSNKNDRQNYHKILLPFLSIEEKKQSVK